MRVALVGGHGKTGRAVASALASRGVEVVATGRAEWDRLAEVLAGCDAAYVIAPNLHPDEASYVTQVLDALGRGAVGRVVYHSVASPYVPAMPHHLGKARSEDLVRRSDLRWTVLQPGAYVQNLDLSGPVEVPYSLDAPFGFLELGDLGEAAAIVLTEPGHVGATYELASRVATVRELADEAGVSAEQVPDPGTHPWLSDMFTYYDDHGLPVGTRVLSWLLSVEKPRPSSAPQ